MNRSIAAYIAPNKIKPKTNFINITLCDQIQKTNLQVRQWINIKLVYLYFHLRSQAVIEQQDLIDSIEQNVIETKDKVQSGTKHLVEAEKHQKKTRKMMLIAAIYCIVTLLIIIISVTA